MGKKNGSRQQGKENEKTCEKELYMNGRNLVIDQKMGENKAVGASEIRKMRQWG